MIKKLIPCGPSHNMLSIANVEVKKLTLIAPCLGLLTIYLFKAAQPRFIKSGTDFIQELILF